MTPEAKLKVSLHAGRRYVKHVEATKGQYLEYKE